VKIAVPSNEQTEPEETKEPTVPSTMDAPGWYVTGMNKNALGKWDENISVVGPDGTTYTDFVLEKGQKEERKKIERKVYGELRGDIEPGWIVLYEGYPIVYHPDGYWHWLKKKKGDLHSRTHEDVMKVKSGIQS
jgi:hypothetical protein